MLRMGLGGDTPPLGGLLQSNRRLLYGNLAVGSWFPLPFRASRCGAVSSLSQRTVFEEFL
jgi:hypothetical protein